MADTIIIGNPSGQPLIGPTLNQTVVGNVPNVPPETRPVAYPTPTFQDQVKWVEQARTPPSATAAPQVVATPSQVSKQTRQNPADKPKQVIDQTKFATPVAKTDVTSEEIRTLEKQTNLTLYPYLFGGELARIKHQFSNLNINKYLKYTP